MFLVWRSRQINSLIFATFVALTVLLAAPTVGQAQEVSAQISRIGDTTHLEFRGRKDWKYDAESPDKSRLVIRTVPISDNAVMQLQSWSCPLIKEIKVDKKAPDGQYEISISYSSPEIESFDYLTDDPSYLIFDFYQQKPKEPPVAVVPPKTSESASGAAATVPSATKSVGSKKAKAGKTNRFAAGDEYKKLDRKPAGSETLVVDDPTRVASAAKSSEEGAEENIDIRFARGVYDGGDPTYERFRAKDYQIREESIIASRQNIYIRFPILAQRTDFFAELMKTPPLYEIQPTEGKESQDENKEARFLISLFEKPHWGSFFETLKFFKAKHPQSKYNEIVMNMEAEAHIRLFERDKDPKDFDKFRAIYRYLVETYPDSVLTERNQLLLAFSSLAQGDGAETLRDLQKYMLAHPRSDYRDKARMAMAESYNLLIKPEDSIRAYEKLVRDADDRNYAVEAAYRIGDVHFGRRDYAKALAAYRDVQKKYPAFKTAFPNAQYNQAECEFWLGQYKDGLNSYVKFLEMFPSHQHGGFALTRVGELLQILGVDQRQVMGAFIEGYFRYPESQGSEVARIRMLSQGLRSMKEREKKRAIAEIDEIAKKSQLPQIQEFAVLMKSDGLSRRAEFNDSLDLLVSFYQANPTTTNLQVFKGRILRNISDIMKEKTEKGDHMDALKFFGKYSTTWLKNSGRIDTPYYQAVAFERAGVPKEARKIYVSLLERLTAIAGKNEEKERQVYEHLPNVSQVQLRLAAVALSDKRYQESYRHLAEVKGPLTQEQEIERVHIGALVSEQMGNTGKAIDYLEKLVAKFKDDRVNVVQPKIDLVRLYIKEAKTKEADSHLAGLEKMHEDKSGLPDVHWARVLELRGDLQLETNQKLAAVETYGRLLDSFETKYSLNSIRYKAGGILFEEGDLKGAEKIWSRFSDGTGQFYKNLASEKLSQAGWQDNYKKYIDRIPAAQGLK
jgi:tetratricopeptide (TPR) repeat protein